MTSCIEEIGGKLFKWTVPPAYTKEGSKKFFFWTEFGRNLPNTNLDGEWLEHKRKLKYYNYKCRYAIKKITKLHIAFGPGTNSTLKKKKILYRFNCQCLGTVDESTECEKVEKSDEFEIEKSDILNKKQEKPYRIFETAAEFKAHNRRISKKYKKKGEKWMFKFGTYLYVKFNM